MDLWGAWEGGGNGFVSRHGLSDVHRFELENKALCKIGNISTNN